MSFTLTAAQRRVLGVLSEKAFTTPDQYPLSVNALVNGCNQKSNRNPVVSFGEGDVVNALQELMHRGLVKLSAVPRGARANRYEHDITSQVPWSPPEQAILTELMLRGPQTVGELRTRCDRMVSMPDLQTVQNTLDALAANAPPEIVVLGRAPGQSAIRYRHNFYSDGETPEVADRVSDAPAASPVSERAPETLARIAALESRIAALEAKVDAVIGV